MWSPASVVRFAPGRIGARANVCGARFVHASCVLRGASDASSATASDDDARVPRRLTADEAKCAVDSIIRVDHAGELGADRIYAGQMFVLGRSPVGPVIKEMWDQEKAHLAKFDTFINEHRVRPTLLQPLWNVAGFALGAGTALLGKEAAMACTVAVENVITDHYNEQLRELHAMGKDDHKDLRKVIQTFRDDEMEHHDKGIQHGAEMAPMYQALSHAITVGCKAAIWLSKRI